MTNKEAIKILENYHNGYFGYKIDEVQEAHNLAIKALEENKIIELFNKYDILLVHRDGKIVPVKNSTKQECYNLLYEIQELIEWRKLLFNKHLNEVINNG